MNIYIDKDGVIATDNRLKVAKKGRSWGIFSEFFNPVTFETEEWQAFYLSPSAARTRGTAQKALADYLASHNSADKQRWYTTTIEAIKNKAEREGVHIEIYKQVY